MRVGLVAMAVPAAVAVGVLIPNHPSGRVPAEDAGVFFYTAQRLLEGGMPYRDVWDHKPPGVYFVSALGLLLGGPVGVWVVQIAFLVAAAVLSYRVLTREFGQVPGTVGSIAWLVAVPRLFLEYGQAQFAEFFALPLQFAALLLYARPLATSRALLIGLLGGLAFLLKPTLLGTWIALAVILLVSARLAALRPLAAIAIAGTVPVALVSGWALFRGALPELIDQVLVYNSVYSSYSSPAERAGAIAVGLRLTLPSGLALIAAASWLYAVAFRRWAPGLLAVALVALPIEVALSALGRGYHYYFLPWLPSMAILVAFVVNELRRRVPARVARAALTVAVLAMCAQPALLVARLATLSDDGRMRAAAAYVAANTRPGDTVFVWGSHTEILFLAGRRSPTRYVYQYGPLATRGYATIARVDELVADLERSRPALIIDASAGSFVTPPLDAAGLRAFVSPDPQYAPLAELERVISFVAANYDRAGSEPTTGFPVWRRR